MCYWSQIAFNLYAILIQYYKSLSVITTANVLAQIICVIFVNI